MAARAPAGWPQGQQQQQQQQQPAWRGGQAVPMSPHSNYQQAPAQQMPQAQQFQNVQAPSMMGQARRPGVPGAPAQQQVPGSTPQVAETYVVSSRGNDNDEVVVRTLTGEYVEKGSNHGRKVYQKTSGKVGMDFVEVYLYYWDSRDGPAFEGWWFGNKLGGTQVWSHCRDSGLKPPPSGWKIPWDGAVRPTLVVASKAEMEQNEAQERVKTLSTDVQAAVSAGQAALEQARATAHDYTSVECLAAAEQMLAPQMPTLLTVQKKLTEAQKGATGDAARLFAQLAMQLRTVQNSLNAELTKIRGSKTKAENDVSQKQMEERDLVLFEGIMPEATEKTNAAEDQVEKTAITAEMIQAAGDDMTEVKRAVDETEAAAKQAQAAIGEARIFINAKLATVRRFESDKVKSQATTDLGKLQAQLQQAQTKLNPLKTCRQEFQQRAAAQKMIAEILEKLSPAEVDVDRAEEATAMLEGENLTKEQMQQAEQAVSRAADHLAAAMKFIDARKKVAQGLAKDELEKLEERAKQSQERLGKLKASHKEANERVAIEVVMKEATEKLEGVQESVGKAADAEGPFLMGVEELPLQETLAAVKACELAVSAANTAISLTRMFIATKLVEVRRFSAGPAAEAQKRLKENQTILEGFVTKLIELKKATAGRKAMCLMREAEAQVSSAEERTKQVAQVAEVFVDDSKLMELSSAQIREAGESTTKSELEANTALAEARKFITARQIEAKGKESSAEVSASLIKLQSRLSAAQSEVGKYKKLSSTVEQRLAAKRVLEEARGKLQAAEDKVIRVDQLVEDLSALSPQEIGEKKDGALPTKKVEVAAAEAQAALKTVARYLDVQSRSQAIAKDEISKLQVQVQVGQKRLDVGVQKMREQSEKLLVGGILTESEDKVKEAEEAVKKAADAEIPFLRGTELPVEEATTAFDALEKLSQVAHTTVGGAKTFLAMKRLAAKRLAETAAKLTSEGLTNLQRRLDEAGQKLGDIKKGMAERRSATVKREALSKVDLVQKKLDEATEATKTLDEGAADMPPDTMKASCEAAGKAQTEAQTLIADTRTLLLTRQRDAKTGSSDPKLVLELKELVEKLAPCQALLDKQKNILRDQEHKFVAQRLKQESGEKLADLESKLENMTKQIAPIVSNQKENWIASVYLQNIVDMLRQHCQKEGKSTEALFKSICGDSGGLDEGKWLSFLLSLPEVKDMKDAFFSEEQVKAAFARMGIEGGDGREQFLDQFRIRYIVTGAVSMTENVSVKEGKTVRKLEIGEVLEGCGEATQETDAGLVRIKAKAAKDDMEGYVTVSGNQGTVFLEPYSSYTAFMKGVDSSMKELWDAVTQTTKYIEQKSEELKIVRSGPLSKTKMELLEMRPKVKKVQLAFHEMKKSITEGRRKIDQCMEVEKRRRQEVADKKAAETMKEECSDAVNPLEAELEKFFPVAKLLVEKKGDGHENPLKALSQCEKDIEGICEKAVKAVDLIKVTLEGVNKASPKGPFGEVRSVLIKLKVKAASVEQKCKKQLQALKHAHKEVAVAAKKAVIGVLLTHVQKNSVSVDKLFADLSDGQAISSSKLRAYLQNITDSGLTPAQLDLGLDGCEAGVTKLGLSGLLQEFYRVVKEIAITSAFNVKDSKTLRKLEVGELVEVLECGKEDIGLPRIRCRALSDLKEGWVTEKGNQGTIFLEKAAKPYFCCEEEFALTSTYESCGSEMRKVAPGEVLEVLEGPRKESALETQRVRGKAQKDGKMGWVTLKDAAGNAQLELTSMLVCKASIAITTTFDIGQGKALRKLDVGETLEIVEAPQEDPARSLTRVKAKARSDGKEGYVTMKGNQGTAYVEETTRHYRCTKSTPLEMRFPSGSQTIRTIEDGELFEVLEGPKVELKQGANRVRGRVLGDASMGWFTLSKKNVQPWSPHYICKAAIELDKDPVAGSAEPVRKLEVGEVLEALDCPSRDKETGLLRVKLRSQQDNAVGFATVKGEKQIFLEPVFVE